MQNVSFEEVVERIVDKDPRFHPDSYEFLREALDFTQQQLAGSLGLGSERHHVSGQQLLEGIRTLGLREFGPMAMTVFHAWGIVRCEDFGEIVFNLIDQRFLRRTETDCRDDFKGGYAFEEAFVHPFLPVSRLNQRTLAIAPTKKL
jgi:uncharacterized repeat protein (TIGR04138 family)